MVKQIIFVRGKNTQDKFVWRYFHLHPTKVDQFAHFYYESGYKSGVFKLIYFDYPTGKVKIWNKWVPKRGKPPTAQPDRVEDINPQIHIRSSEGTIDKSQKYPSILGLYDFIQAQPHHSIVSLQIFSHGYYGGPVIWNDSYEDSQLTQLTDDRDVHDTEFRLRDFFGKNPLAGKKGVKFAKAFCPGALVKIWGCFAEQNYIMLIWRWHKLSNTPKNNEKRAELLDLYLFGVEFSYAFLLSRLLKQTVWGVAVGWGSNPFGKDQSYPYLANFPPKLDREMWWSVHTFTGKYRRFYTDVLKASIDATNYVGYNNKWFTQAQRANNTVDDFEFPPLGDDLPLMTIPPLL